jgi:hypothetical protein
MSITKQFLVAAAAISLTATACVQKDEPPAAIARAIPTPDQVKIKLPDNGNRTIGDLAEFYVSTRNITRTLNGASAWVLILIHTIVQFPVTTVEDNVYTWGPFSDALDPAEYKLTVIDNGDNTYAYALAGRNKIDGTDFEDVITGLADTNAGEDLGNGLFKLDFEAGRRVNPIDADPDARGTVEVVYDLADKAQVMHIQSTDDNGAPIEANYAYNEADDGGGEMVFGLEGDMGGGPEAEAVLIHSRWLGGGDGRADVAIKGGNTENPAGVLASECWGSTFKRSFFAVLAGDSTGAFGAAEGDEASCAFADAKMPEQP